MGWVEDLHGAVVGVDTAPLIYFIEEHPHYAYAVDPFFEAMEAGALTVVTSVITLSEVLVRPLRDKNAELARRYRNVLLFSANLITRDISAEVAEEASGLRARYNLATPDALQLAVAAREGCSHFLTNDARLTAIASPQVLVLDRLLRENPS